MKAVINPNPERYELYTRFYKLYREIYESLEVCFDKLAEIS